MKAEKIKIWLSQAAQQYGFEKMAVTEAHYSAPVAERLSEFIDKEYFGEMQWLADTKTRRSSPQQMWDEAQSAIVLGCNYGPETDPLETVGLKDRANISVYARGRDYHDLLKGRLKQIASQLASRSGWQVKVFVDTAPLMEKPLAAQAGIGWQGKHTNLVSREFGSWLFLGVILTDGKLAPDTASDDHCGQCRACLDICPTDAFPSPYQLDARKCISYLTIEYKGHIPRHFRAKMGNRIFGCDDCLAVCPWNKFAQQTSEIKFSLGQEKPLYPLSELLDLDEQQFRSIFAGTPVKRTGYVFFMRNLLIAAGNADDITLSGHVMPHLHAESPYIRAMAVWSLSQMLPPEELKQLLDEDEPDEQVQLEWQQALYPSE